MTISFLHKVSLISLFTWISFSLSAQIIKEREYFLNGLEDYEKGNYREALYFFEYISSQSETNQDAIYYSALCRLYLHEPEQALQDLKSVHLPDLENDNHYYYWLAEAYFQNEQFGEALEYLKIYAERVEKNRISKYSTLLQNLKASIERIYQYPSPFYVENMGNHINSKYQETSLTKDKDLLYGSNRLSFDGNGEARKQQAVYSFYGATLDRKGKDKYIEVWYKSIETEESSFRVLQRLSHQPYQERDIFLVSEKGILKTIVRQKGKWLQAKVFSEVLSEQKGAIDYAYLTPDRKTIVYSLDYRRKGNHQLFVAQRENKETDFDKPQFINQVNTDAQEISPFLAKDLTLYFSSDRDSSAGGFDIFQSTYNSEKQTWNFPTQFHYPINSVSDDTFFQTDENIAYFISNRKGGEGEEDIYQVFFMDSLLVEGHIKTREGLLSRTIEKAKITFASSSTPDTILTFSDKEGFYRTKLPIRGDYEMTVWVDNSLKYQDYFELNPYQIAQKNSSYSRIVNAYIYVPQKTRMELDSSFFDQQLYLNTSNDCTKKIDDFIAKLDTQKHQLMLFHTQNASSVSVASLRNYLINTKEVPENLITEKAINNSSPKDIIFMEIVKPELSQQN